MADGRMRRRHSADVQEEATCDVYDHDKLFRVRRGLNKGRAMMKARIGQIMAQERIFLQQKRRNEVPRCTTSLANPQNSTASWISHLQGRCSNARIEVTPLEEPWLAMVNATAMRWLQNLA